MQLLGCSSSASSGRSTRAAQVDCRDAMEAPAAFGAPFRRARARSARAQRVAMLLHAPKLPEPRSVKRRVRPALLRAPHAAPSRVRAPTRAEARRCQPSWPLGGRTRATQVWAAAGVLHAAACGHAEQRQQARRSPTRPALRAPHLQRRSSSHGARQGGSCRWGRTRQPAESGAAAAKRRCARAVACETSRAAVAGAAARLWAHAEPWTRQ